MRMPWKDAAKWCVIITVVIGTRVLFGGWEEGFSQPYYIGCYATIIMLAIATSFSDWVDRMVEEK